MQNLTEEGFEAKTLEGKLLWLFRETQAGMAFDNRLSERIVGLAQQLALVGQRLDALERGK